MSESVDAVLAQLVAFLRGGRLTGVVAELER